MNGREHDERDRIVTALAENGCEVECVVKDGRVCPVDELEDSGPTITGGPVDEPIVVPVDAFERSLAAWRQALEQKRQAGELDEADEAAVAQVSRQHRRLDLHRLRFREQALTRADRRGGRDRGRRPSGSHRRTRSRARSPGREAAGDDPDPPGGRAHACPFCGLEFRWPGRLEQHRVFVHGGEWS